MKKAEEYIKDIDFKTEDHGEAGSFEVLSSIYEFTKNDIIHVIKMAQIDVIEEAVKRCANEPVYKVIGTHNQATNLVRKEILKIAEQLRKEIE